MKNLTILLLTISLFFVSGCEKHFPIKFGFNTPLDKNSKGLVIADVDKQIEKLYLHGNIELSEGELEVSLLDPDGSVIYTELLAAPDTFLIMKCFDAKEGYWKLKYKSYEGSGFIDLHLNF